jgi:LysM repeat protein
MSELNQKPQNNIVAKIFAILLALALLASAFPQVAVAAPAPSATATCSKYYTVASGDTLSSISVKYDVSIAELAAANNLKEPYTLIVGQSLCIPGSATTTTTTTTSSSSSKTSWTATRDGNFLVIKATNFPKKGNYYVKIKKGHQGTDTPWVKLGIFRTKKNTDVTRYFRLPKNFTDPSLITVCMKNAKSDAVQCQPVSKTP